MERLPNNKQLLTTVGFSLFLFVASLAYGTALGSVASSVGFISDYGFVVLVNSSSLLVSVAAVCLARRRGVLSRSKLCGAAIVSLGGALLASLFEGNAWIVSGALCGVFLACQWIAWIELFSARGASRADVTLEICAGFTLSAMLVGIASFVPLNVVKVLVIAGALLSSGIYVFLGRHGQEVQRGGADESRLVDRRSLISTFIYFFVLVAVIGALHTALLNSPSQHILGSLPLWVSRLIPSVLMLFISLFAKEFLRPASVFQVIFLVMIVVFSLLPLFSGQLKSIPGLIVSIGYSMCTIAFVTYVARFSHAAGFTAFELPAVYMAGSCASLLVGFAVGFALNYAGGALNLHLESLISLFSIYPLAVAFFFLMKRSLTGRSRETVPERNAEGDTDDTHRLEHLTKRYALTERETEIFAFLAKGRSARVIAEDLVISENTVWFHIKKIYAKVGVHSKQELIDLIEAERETKE